MATKFLGISGHLETQAPGHFETFHRGLFEAFQKEFGSQNNIFLGKQGEKNLGSWFIPAIPNSFTSTIPWLSRKFLDKVLSHYLGSDSRTVLYVYEGNLSTLFLLSQVLRKNQHVFLYINFFNTEKHLRYVNSPIAAFIYRNLVKFAVRKIEQQVRISVDSKRFAEIFSNALRRDVIDFPMYSCLIGQNSDRERSRILINLRGNQAEEFLRFAIKSHAELRNIELDIHGIHNPTIAKELSEMGKIRVLSDFLDFKSYANSYRSYFRVAFLYDPKFFSFQSSGRLADAIMADAEIVVPENTSLFDVLQEFGNGNSFEFGNDASFVTALTTKPSIPKQSHYLPSSTLTAQFILESIRSIEHGMPYKRQFHSAIVDQVIDESIRGLLFILRLMFGLKRRIRSIGRACRNPS